MATRSEQLADALLSIARVNHYMIGLVEPITFDELDAAYQILIDGIPPDAAEDSPHNLAMDIVEDMRREAVSTASAGKPAPAWLKPDAS